MGMIRMQMKLELFLAASHDLGKQKGVASHKDDRSGKQDEMN